MTWYSVCRVDDIVVNTGVGALIEGRQVAVFRLEDDSVYAIDNFDPNSQANVLSRGIVGDLGGDVVVASPIYKQHFKLTSGECLEVPENSIAAHQVRVESGVIQVRLRTELNQAA